MPTSSPNQPWGFVCHLPPPIWQGGALGSVACVVQQHHPADPRRPLIDYSLALVLTPTLLLGCNTGEEPGVC